MKKRWLSVVAIFSLVFAALFAGCKEKVAYPITVEGVQGGLVALSASEASAGETVTVTCTPDEGFIYKEGSLKVNGEVLEGMSFIMPDKSVIITAEFLRVEGEAP